MHPIPLILTLSIALGLTACTDSKKAEQKALLDQSEATMVEFNATLDKITDVASAKASQANLERLGKALGEAAAKLEASGEVPEEVMKEFEARVKPIAEKITANMMRLNQDKDILPIISGAMMAIMQAAQQAQGNEAPEGSSARYRAPPE